MFSHDSNPALNLLYFIILVHERCIENIPSEITLPPCAMPLILTYQRDCFLLPSLILHLPFSEPLHCGSHPLIKKYFHVTRDFQLVSLSSEFLFLPGLLFSIITSYPFSSTPVPKVIQLFLWHPSPSVYEQCHLMSALQSQ